jgi:DNA-binding YbaB/EbfC family protein
MEDFAKMLAKAKEVQAQMHEVQQKLSHLHATAESGAGAVRATVDGHKSVLKLEIADEYLPPEEKKTLQDLIIAAITLATNAVDDRIKEEIEQNAPGLIEGLPL